MRLLRKFVQKCKQKNNMNLLRKIMKKTVKRKMMEPRMTRRKRRVVGVS